MADWEGDDWQRGRADDGIVTEAESHYHEANRQRKLADECIKALAACQERSHQLEQERDELREALHRCRAAANRAGNMEIVRIAGTAIAASTALATKSEER